MKHKCRGIVRLILLGVLGIGGIAAAAVQGRDTDEGAGEGRQMWTEYPSEVTGFYYMYDDTGEPPFSDLLPLPQGPYSNYTLHDNPGAIKLDRFNNEAKNFTFPDSFFYFGIWFEPDYMHRFNVHRYSPDGHLELIYPAGGEMNYPLPPDEDPPIPNNDIPQAVIAPLWHNYNPMLDPLESDINCQYYWYDTTENKLWFELYKVKHADSEREYTFMASLQLGGDGVDGGD